MDHLAELQKQFAHNLQVIAISAESEERLRRYLQKKPTKVWIGVDSDKSMLDVYDPQEIPHSVVIDTNGIVAAITYPDEISASRIQKLLSGERVQFKEKKRYAEKRSAPDSQAFEERKIFYVSIIRSKSPKTYSQVPNEGEFKKRRIIAARFTVPMLYQLAYRLPSYKRILLNLKNPQQYEYENAEKYDLDLIVPEAEKENLYDILIYCLKKSFPVKAALEKRKVKVKILKVATQGKLRKSDGSETMYTFRGPSFNAKNITIKRFAEYLESFMTVPVVDETELSERYDIELDWQFEDPKTLYDALEKLGLVLEDGERYVDLLVFSD